MSEAVKITIDDLTAAAAELRRLHALNAELVEERDELRTENRVLVRQNGRWQEKMETTEALNAELVEALRSVVAWMDAPDESAFSDTQLAAARAALAKVEANK